MKKMKVNELYEQIMSLIKENSGSMLSFENEQEEAKRILHQQKELQLVLPIKIWWSTNIQAIMVPISIGCFYKE